MAYRRASSFILTPPKTATFWVAVAIAGLGVILNYNIITVAALSPYAFIMVVLAFVLLAIGCASRGL